MDFPKHPVADHAMKPRSLLACLILSLLPLLTPGRCWAGTPAFPLKVSENGHYLEDSAGKPFFVMGDTPWFIQKLKIEDVRMPDTAHQFITAGFGEWKQADYATAPVANDGTCAAVYLPTPRTFTADLAKLKKPFTARWFDPASGQFQDVSGLPSAGSGKCELTPPGKNAAGESDWVLVLGPPGMR